MQIQHKHTFAPLDLALENVGRPVFLINEHAQIVYANKIACQTLGFSETELYSLYINDIEPASPMQIWADSLSKIKLSKFKSIESYYITKRKKLLPVEVHSYYFEYQHHDYMLNFVRDISNRDSLKEQLKTSEAKFRTLVEHSPDVIIRYDKNCNRVFINGAYERAFGISADMALGKKPSEAWGKSSMSGVEFEEILHEVMQTGETIEVELEWFDGNENYMAQALRMTPERDGNDVIISVLTYSRDITERNRLRNKLSKNEEAFRTLVEHSPDNITRYDTECHRTYINPKAVKELAVEMDFLLGKTPTEHPGDALSIKLQQKITEVVNTGLYLDFEFLSQDDKTCTHMRMTPEFDTKGNVAHVLAIGRDITEIDQYRQQIHQQAFFDSLTNLPNRALLLDRIKQVATDANRYEYQFGLMLLDLDQFKEINDALGHSIGDLLLCEVAKRLQQCLREYDTVARLGGDEFAILISKVSNSLILSNVADTILKSLVAPFVIEDKELFVSASIGIAIYSGTGTEIDALFKHADSAMYFAKKQGRNNYQFYDTELTTLANKRRMLETALRKAKKNNELELYYQAQIDMPLNKLIGAEALLRWNHPELGLVMPDKFITILEESGLINEVGEWVLHTACKQAVIWNKLHIKNNSQAKPFVVAVNLSTRQFIRNDLAGQIKQILQQTGCQAAWIKLEITESLLLEDNNNVTNILDALSTMGLSISIDDFGTGYSALGYLNRFPVNQIKLDRSFISDTPNNIQKSALVKAMLSIAKALNLDVVAEGVETSENLSYLVSEGCRTGQGYLFCKPMPVDQFDQYIIESNRNN